MKRTILFFLPKRFDAITLGGRVYMRDSSDITLYAHERVHAVQQNKNPIMFYFRYVFSKKWRLKYEAEAYAESVNAGHDFVLASLYLSKNYYLGISYEEAYSAIGKHL